MIASKVVCDDTYSNKSWCVVGQNLFALKEMNQMEREMCGYLDWQLNADPTDLESFERDLRSRFGLTVPCEQSSTRYTTSRPTPAPLVIPNKSTSYANPVSAVLTPPPSPSPASSSPLTPFDTPSSGAPSPASSEETCLTPPSDHEPHVHVHTSSLAHQMQDSRMSISNLTSPDDVYPANNFYHSSIPSKHSNTMMNISAPPKAFPPTRSNSEPSIMPSRAEMTTIKDKVESSGKFALGTMTRW
jgi:hypothetical protein